MWLKVGGFNLILANNVEEAIKKLILNEVDIVISVMRFDETDEEILSGLQILDVAQNHKPPIPVVLWSDFLTNSNIREAVKKGVQDFYSRNEIVENGIQYLLKIINDLI
jgi:DNA-binding NtrC family response regulator